MPINRKLTAVILSTCTCMLLLAGAAMIVMDVVTSRKAMVENMTVLADLLGRHTIAPLTFHREEDAEEVKQTLSAIQADPHILVACLYDKGQNRFGDYARAGAVRNFPVQPPADGYRFTRDYLRNWSSPRRIGPETHRHDLPSSGSWAGIQSSSGCMPKS